MSNVDIKHMDIKVSIIIVNWNNGKMTKSCIDSVIKNTHGVSYEIIVVDNGSNFEQLNVLRDYKLQCEFVLIELNSNLYFGEANNIGVEMASGCKILLLNNDVTLTENYLKPLLEALSHEYMAGAVGPKFYYPDGRLQEAGAFVRHDGWTVQHGKRDKAANIISQSGPHIVDYCSAACLLMRRDMFLRLGGFDPSYDPGYFEDVDLMLRLRSAGFFTYLCTDVSVVHEENTTSDSIWHAEKRQNVILESHRTFVGRWGNYISERIFNHTLIPKSLLHDWKPSNSASMENQHLTFIAIRGPGLVNSSIEWINVLALASKFSTSDHVIFVADEACSRCRIYSLSAQNNISLGSFSIMRMSDLIAIEKQISFSIEINSDRSAIIVQSKLEHRSRAAAAIAHSGV